jgi:predicted Zn-dependent protease with MMP-like domain
MRAYPTRDALMRGVRETFDHEVAHHLGISDDRMREIKGSRSQ